ncbi:predicted protein [Phaeodactylum tricornutum CCAP 1055/1]|uniref:Uncharacterized protein n=1 Tax=Phaeodactylum tricornutum (strain CCAP 1055/1) TaxID=556484 RepID=B7GEH2_PHATC|nr:predicted protein [Phaeodactylum tricornutum CCAP 1055/1]EEC42973.1 predicted protein [Phaeodactylum tricornutum CCAP 1055/1]|eukprot:XP_002185486.1 predicted protein [Phaeodactylum tricornutum CCAP 1055/1]
MAFYGVSNKCSDRIPVFVFMIFLDWFEYILLTSSSFRLDPNLDEQNTVQAKSRERVFPPPLDDVAYDSRDRDAFVAARHAAATANDSFALEMKERARTRRARQDQVVSDLKVQIRRVEAALQAETKRRVHGLQNLQQQTEASIRTLQENLEESWRLQQTATDDRWQQLADRLTALEESWRVHVARWEDRTGSESAQAREMLRELQEQAEVAQREREIREESLRQRLENVAQEAEQAWDEARRERRAATDELQTRLERYDDNVEAHVQGLQQTLRQELAALQADLQREQTERATADQDIANVLNRYTETIQNSLAVVSDV